MRYAIEPIFVIFPLICFLFYVANFKQKKTVCFILAISFILIYCFSLNGSDFYGYYTHYNMVGNGVSSSDNAQEIGYFYLMKAALRLGLDYLSFRVVLLSTMTIVLFYAVTRFTKDFSLVLFFISSMFVVYTISAYRQYIVIAISLYWIYKFNQGKVKTAICGTAALLLFHITAVLPLGCMVFTVLRKRRKVEKSADMFKRNFSIIITLALLTRVMATVLLRTAFFYRVVGGILGAHSTPNPTLFSFGLLSRLVFLAGVTYLFRASGTDDRAVHFLFWYYFVSIAIYVAIPLELVMGRLMNNASILCAILIPMLKREVVVSTPTAQAEHRKQNVKLLLMFLEFVAIAILINQLLKQNGYTPYMNILLGDRPDYGMTW
ncbi:MAG: EpsG family protein [Lachnospiraceae bacterium]|nr:EpsG family protein [Lachnospiraceae bacterium]